MISRRVQDNDRVIWMREVSTLYLPMSPLTQGAVLDVSKTTSWT